MSASEEEFRPQAEALWREHDELQRWIGGQAIPWLAPDMCVTVPVRRLGIA
jgi:hypothetical protein